MYVMYAMRIYNDSSQPYKKQGELMGCITSRRVLRQAAISARQLESGLPSGLAPGRNGIHLGLIQEINRNPAGRWTGSTFHQPGDPDPFSIWDPAGSELVV